MNSAVLAFPPRALDEAAAAPAAPGVVVDFAAYRRSRGFFVPESSAIAEQSAAETPAPPFAPVVHPPFVWVPVMYWVMP